MPKKYTEVPWGRHCWAELCQLSGHQPRLWKGRKNIPGWGASWLDGGPENEERLGGHTGQARRAQWAWLRTLVSKSEQKNDWRIFNQENHVVICDFWEDHFSLVLGLDLKRARETTAEATVLSTEGRWQLGWNGSLAGSLQMGGCYLRRTQKLDIEGGFLAGGSGC